MQLAKYLQCEIQSHGFFLQAGAHKELRNAKKPQLQSKHRTKHSYASRLSQRGPLPTCRDPSKARPLATTPTLLLRPCWLNHLEQSGLEPRGLRKKKKTMDIIRHLENKIAIKLSNFPKLKLSKVDRCSILQAVSHPARLHGNANSWSKLTPQILRRSLGCATCRPNRGMDGKLATIAARSLGCRVQRRRSL